MDVRHWLRSSGVARPHELGSRERPRHPQERSDRQPRERGERRVEHLEHVVLARLDDGDPDRRLGEEEARHAAGRRLELPDARTHPAGLAPRPQRQDQRDAGPQAVGHVDDDVVVDRRRDRAFAQREALAARLVGVGGRDGRPHQQEPEGDARQPRDEADVRVARRRVGLGERQPHDDEEDGGEERRRGSVVHDHRPRHVIQEDGDPAQHDLQREQRERDRHRRGHPPLAPAQAVDERRQDDERHREHGHDPAVHLLDQRVVAAGDELAVARGPVGAAEPGVRHPHVRPDRHERPGQRRDERGERDQAPACHARASAAAARRRSSSGRSERIGGRLSKLCGGGGEDVYHSSV